MSDEIQPALTPDEWMHLGSRPLEDGDGATRRHALAALCLHGQPFGFTQEDVDLLERDADHHVPNRLARVQSLIARIAALLPPQP